MNESVNNHNVFSSEEEEELQCFVDSVSFEVMRQNPVVLPCGHTFEESTISQLRQHAYLRQAKCPSCRREIPAEYTAIPNTNLKQAIETIGECIILPRTPHKNQKQQQIYKLALALQQAAEELIKNSDEMTSLEVKNEHLQTEIAQLRAENQKPRTTDTVKSNHGALTMSSVLGVAQELKEDCVLVFLVMVFAFLFGYWGYEVYSVYWVYWVEIYNTGGVDGVRNMVRSAIRRNFELIFECIRDSFHPSCG